MRCKIINGHKQHIKDLTRLAEIILPDYIHELQSMWYLIQIAKKINSIIILRLKTVEERTILNKKYHLSKDEWEIVPPEIKQCKVRIDGIVHEIRKMPLPPNGGLKQCLQSLKQSSLEIIKCCYRDYPQEHTADWTEFIDGVINEIS
ncbi:MAG: hypothetical protein ABIH39_03420 [Candidatus Margulisiibacteriota bacterium]